MALKLQGTRRKIFENFQNMSSRNEGMQFRLNEMNDLSRLRIEWAKMCLTNRKEKVKTKWHLNLGHNKTAILIW